MNIIYFLTSVGNIFIYIDEILLLELHRMFIKSWKTVVLEIFSDKQSNINKIILFGNFLQAWKDSIRKGWTEIEEDYRFS